MVGVALMVWGTLIALGRFEVVSRRPSSGEDLPTDSESGA